MNTWKKVNIDFPTIKLGDFIEPIKTTVADLGLDNPVVYGVTNIEGITQTGKPASKDLGKYIALEKDCFAYNPYRINVGSIGINELNLQGCVSPAYVVFKTKNGLLPKFLFHYIKSEFGIHLINWYGNKGGVRNALRFDDLCKIDIPDITKLNQEEILTQLDEYKDKIQVILEEIESQKAYAKQLRQNILQDAIEGKLTAEWRKTHPVIKGNPDFDAEALLEEIHKEKKSDKKQKELAPIGDDEKPFEIPEGWKWVRLGSLIQYTENLDIQKKLQPNEIVNYVDIDSIDNNKYKIESPKEKFVSELSSRARRVLKQGFIIYSTVRPYLCNIAIIEEQKKNFIGSTGFNVFKPIYLNIYYVFNFLLSPYVIKLYKSMMQGFNSPSINNEQFENTILPLPPLKEQEEIVNIVNSNLKKIEILEQQIAQREEYANQLMQSILKNAFEER